MSDRSWDPTEPLREDHLRRLEEARLRKERTQTWTDPMLEPVPNPSSEFEAFSFLAAWSEEEQKSEALCELRRIRIGIYVTAAGMLVLALAVVLLAMVLSAKPN